MSSVMCSAPFLNKLRVPLPNNKTQGIGKIPARVSEDSAPVVIPPITHKRFL